VLSLSKKVGRIKHLLIQICFVASGLRDILGELPRADASRFQSQVSISDNNPRHAFRVCVCVCVYILPRFEKGIQNSCLVFCYCCYGKKEPFIEVLPPEMVSLLLLLVRIHNREGGCVFVIYHGLYLNLIEKENNLAELIFLYSAVKLKCTKNLLGMHLHINML
jgi:hypothetical protein